MIPYYALDFNPQHCTNTHGQQQARLIRHSGIFYLRAEKIDIPTGHDIYPATTTSIQSIAVIQPTEKAKQQQEQHAPLTHTQTKDYEKSLVEILTAGNSMATTTSGFSCPTPEELHDGRLTIINRQGQEQEQLQENTKQLSKQELQRRLEGDNWTKETRFRRKITPLYRP